MRRSLNLPNTSLVLDEVVARARKEFEGLRQAIHGLHVETANTVTNLQQLVVHLESNSSRSTQQQGLLAPEEHHSKELKELRRQGGRVEELAGGNC